LPFDVCDFSKSIGCVVYMLQVVPLLHAASQLLHTHPLSELTYADTLAEIEMRKVDMSCYFLLQEELESSRQSLRNLQDSFARVTDQNNR
jgi:hypothetical protein